MLELILNQCITRGKDWRGGSTQNRDTLKLSLFKIKLCSISFGSWVPSLNAYSKHRHPEMVLTASGKNKSNPWKFAKLITMTPSHTLCFSQTEFLSVLPKCAVLAHLQALMHTFPLWGTLPCLWPFSTLPFLDNSQSSFVSQLLNFPHTQPLTLRLNQVSPLCAAPLIALRWMNTVESSIVLALTGRWALYGQG